MEFPSKRSPLICLHGCVCSSTPLAAEAGYRILRAGGNAADAAIAIAAALNVTEPCSTGLGGDCFCLFYDAKHKKVRGLNGSGRAPHRLSLEVLKGLGYSMNAPVPARHALNVTVPGAAAGWVDTVQQFGSGKLSLLEILSPAIDLAEGGFPVSPTVAVGWAQGEELLLQEGNPHGIHMLYQGTRAPRAGEVMRLPLLANTFKVLAKEGKKGFYEGQIAKSIVDIVGSRGGCLAMEDLQSHLSTFDDPIKVTYKGVNVWEMPPSGQGLTALMALNILKGFDFKDIAYGSAGYWHLVIEALKISFADTCWYVTDPSKGTCPVDHLLKEEYAAERRQLINPAKATQFEKGKPFCSSDTVYFSVVDMEGNACSFINSNYMGFGTGLVPEGCGFTLHNRGANFFLDPSHPNCVAAAKRPYHTIIPGMATVDGSEDLYASFGVMGGFMQPQGHVQVLLNMIDYGMDPQAALDAPRVCLGDGYSLGGSVHLEEGISTEATKGLAAMGHNVSGPVCGRARSLFGRGQIIQAQRERVMEAGSGTVQTVWWAGSDGRGDSLAIGY